MEKNIPIQILLADDHPLIMSGFAIALADQGVKVVGQTRTPDEAIKKYQELQPDVLVLDIRFGEKLTGLDAAKKILKQFPNAKIIFLSQFDQDALIKEAYRLGAHAFITKSCDPELLANAIQYAHRGEQYFPPEIMERLAQLAIRGDDSPQSLLEPRELEIFKLMAQGLMNIEIAEQLKLSNKTISTMTQAIKEKLGVQRSVDITRIAVKHGLIDL